MGFVPSNDIHFDLDVDDRIDPGDVTWWLQWVADSVGDVNLDGVFDSSDLVHIAERAVTKDRRCVRHLGRRRLEL